MSARILALNVVLAALAALALAGYAAVALPLALLAVAALLFMLARQVPPARHRARPDPGSSP